MKEKFSEIIEILEKADQIFQDFAAPEEAQTLWNAGIEKLAAAIWICERDDGQENAEKEPATDV